MTDEPFIPPDPHEPIPPPQGATDEGAGGVLVDPAEIDAAIEMFAATLAAAVTGAPTWSQTYKLAHSQLAEWARGRLRENVNTYTIWYYGDHTAAAFCFIFISWVLAHAGGSQAAGLELIGGKKAYVPYIRHIDGYEAGHGGMRVGAVVAIHGFSHIGFCVADHGSTFDLLSGNSVYGASDDAVTVKRYSKSVVSGHVNLDYGRPPAPTHHVEDPMPERYSLGSTKTETAKAGEWTILHFGDQYDPADPHHKRGFWGNLCTGPADYSCTVDLTLSTRTTGLVRLIEVDPKKNYATAKVKPAVRFDTDLVSLPQAGRHVDSGHHLYVEIKPDADVTVGERHAELIYWKS